MREQKRKRIVTLLSAVVFSLFAVLGWQAQHIGQSKPLWAVLAAAALFVPMAAALGRLLERLSRCARQAVPARPFRPLRAFLLILACYVPMFLVSYPGAFAYDVPFQLEQVFAGPYSAHHPLAHTLLLGGCVKLGHALGQINLGAALYTLLQMTALAACFAASCASIARQSGARAARLSAVFFALYPLHMMMAVNATKDVLFSGLFALLLALAREALTGGRMSGRMAAAIVLSGAGMMLLRNNALYAVAGGAARAAAAACAEAGRRADAGGCAVHGRKRRHEGGDECGGGRPVRDALLADSAAGALAQSA